MATTETPALGQPAVDIKEGDVATDDLRLWSVTTLIKALHSPALEYWAIEETAKAAVHQQRAWRPLAEDDPDGAIKWLMEARFKRPKGQRTSAQLGEDVHNAIESYTLTGTKPTVDDEVRPFLDRFDEWLQEWQPEYHSTEVTVYSPTYGYAGRTDTFLTIRDVPRQALTAELEQIEGVRLIGDYKTSRESFTKRGQPKTPYSEDALQLAAYRFAEMAAAWRPRRFERYRRRYYVLGPTEQELAVPVPQVDGGAVIHITPDRCLMFPVRCDEEVHRSFLYVVEAARWVNELSKHVVGEPMERPAAEDGQS